MTLPVDYRLPTQSDLAPEDTERYLYELVKDMERMYSRIAVAVNGDISSYNDIGAKKYEPKIEGLSSAGTGTYTHQYGWTVRQGIMVDVWFDVLWTGHTGTGNMAVSLPYQCTLTAGKPFVGVIQASNITATANTWLVANVNSGSRQAYIWESVASGATGQVAIDTAGQLIGHVRYIGREEER